MAALKNLKEKLDGAQKDLDELVADFNKVVELRHSIQAADSSLKGTSDIVADMAMSLKHDALALRECVGAMKSAAEIISTIDPDEIKETYGRIEGRVERLEESSEQMERGISESANRERLALAIVIILLVMTAANLFYTASARSGTQTALAPAATQMIALRGSIPEDAFETPAIQPAAQRDEPRIAELCSPPNFDENADCSVNVSETQRGSGVRRKDQST